MSQTGWELRETGLQDPVLSFKLVNDLSDFKTDVLGGTIIRKSVNPSKYNGYAHTTRIIQNTCATDYINGFCMTVKITQQLSAKHNKLVIITEVPGPLWEIRTEFLNSIKISVMIQTIILQYTVKGISCRTS